MKSCMDCKHTYHSEICRECFCGDKFEPRPNAPEPNKERAELMNLRRRVEAQREEIRRLQAGRSNSMTVYDLWLTTTNDIFLRRPGRENLKLPSGGRLQLEHRVLRVEKIEIVTRASEAPALLVTTADSDDEERERDEERKRELTRSNYAAQLDALGYYPDGSPKVDT